MNINLGKYITLSRSTYVIERLFQDNHEVNVDVVSGVKYDIDKEPDSSNVCNLSGITSKHSNGFGLGTTSGLNYLEPQHIIAAINRFELLLTALMPSMKISRHVAIHKTGEQISISLCNYIGDMPLDDGESVAEKVDISVCFSIIGPYLCMISPFNIPGLNSTKNKPSEYITALFNAITIREMSEDAFNKLISTDNDIADNIIKCFGRITEGIHMQSENYVKQFSTVPSTNYTVLDQEEIDALITKDKKKAGDLYRYGDDHKSTTIGDPKSVGGTVDVPIEDRKMVAPVGKVDNMKHIIDARYYTPFTISLNSSYDLLNNGIDECIGLVASERTVHDTSVVVSQSIMYAKTYEDAVYGIPKYNNGVLGYEELYTVSKSEALLESPVSDDGGPKRDSDGKIIMNMKRTETSRKAIISKYMITHDIIIKKPTGSDFIMLGLDIDFY